MKKYLLLIICVFVTLSVMASGSQNQGTQNDEDSQCQLMSHAPQTIIKPGSWYITPLSEEDFRGHGGRSDRPVLRPGSQGTIKSPFPESVEASLAESYSETHVNEAQSNSSSVNDYESGDFTGLEPSDNTNIGSNQIDTRIGVIDLVNLIYDYLLNEYAQWDGQYSYIYDPSTTHNKYKKVYTEDNTDEPLGHGGRSDRPITPGIGNLLPPLSLISPSSFRRPCDYPANRLIFSNIQSAMLGASSPAMKLGDVNHDNELDVQDVIDMIKHILTGEGSVNGKAAVNEDMDGDGQLSISDVAELISKVLNADSK